MTYTQYIAIVALWEQDHQTVSGLGEKLFLESNTLTPILKKLEAMGYLRRQRDPADERQVVVSLTAAGPQVARNGFDAGISWRPLACPPDEFANLQKSVVSLRESLRRHAKSDAGSVVSPR